MPRRTLSSLAALLTALFLLACAGLGDLDLDEIDGVPPPTPAYAGTWEGPGMLLVITPQGEGRVEQRGQGTSTSFAGQITAWEEDTFALGALGMTFATYRIDEPPFEGPDGWEMVVEGIRLERTGEGILRGPPYAGDPSNAPGPRPPAPDPFQGRPTTPATTPPDEAPPPAEAPASKPSPAD